MTDLMTIEDIAAMFRVDVRTVRERWVHQPDFPAPTFQPSPRRRFWARDVIIAWATPGGRRSARATLESTC